MRLRESGHIFIGEVYVAPVDPKLAPLAEMLDAAGDDVKRLNWRLHDITITLAPPRRASEADAHES